MTTLFKWLRQIVLALLIVFGLALVAVWTLRWFAKDESAREALALMQQATPAATGENGFRWLAFADRRIPERLEGEAGPPLCVLEDFPYSPERHAMAPGESLFLFTDGVTEAMNAAGELYGRQRLLTALRSMREMREAAEAGVVDVDGLAFDVFARNCPSRGTLEHVTGRWGVLTMGALYDSSLRFNELRRRVDGVSEKMLSQTLHALERDGLVHRDAQPTNPPRP